MRPMRQPRAATRLALAGRVLLLGLGELLTALHAALHAVAHRCHGRIRSFLAPWLVLPGGLALRHPSRDRDLVSLVVRDVVALALQLVRQVLLRDVVALEVVGEQVADTDAVGLHAPVS